jgi:dTDP-4-amino-4,6-dideoxygalactose transaminase
MDEIQAAVVRAKLPMLDEWNERRRQIHAVYEQAAPGGVRMVNRAGPGFVGHLAVVEHPDRGSAISHLDGAGIRTDVHYPVPDHRQPVLASDPDVSDPVALPVTERAAETVLSLPLFPWLRDDEVDRVATALAGVPA